VRQIVIEFLQVFARQGLIAPLGIRTAGHAKRSIAYSPFVRLRREYEGVGVPFLASFARSGEFSAIDPHASNNY
jgi:hypothetical protein